MIFNDIYKTTELKSEGIYKEKRSKFLAFAFPVTNEVTAKELIQNLKHTYYNANHHCFAWRLGISGSNFRIDDDGEPSGTAGKPILGQIKSHQLTNILIVIIRYFGGIKLGTNGLIRAYKAASDDVIANASIIEKTVNNFFNISFSYNSMNDVMKIIKDENPEIICQQFGLNCLIKISIRQAKSAELISRIEKIDGVKTEFLYSQ